MLGNLSIMENVKVYKGQNIKRLYIESNAESKLLHSQAVQTGIAGYVSLH